jgi:hypothetical protein
MVLDGHYSLAGAVSIMISGKHDHSMMGNKLKPVTTQHINLP